MKNIPNSLSYTHLVLVVITSLSFLVSCGGGTIGGDSVNNPASQSVVVATGNQILLSDVVTELSSEAVGNSISDSAKHLLETTAAAGPIRFMAVGDSITQGVRGYRSYRSDFLNLLSDTTCAVKMVGSQSHTLHSSDYYSAHESFAGRSADAFLFSYDDLPSLVESVQTHKPDVILLHVGTVDILRGDTAVTALADIDRLIATIFESKPNTVVMLANLIPVFGDEPSVLQVSSVLAVGIEQLVYESNFEHLLVVDVRSGYTAEMMQRDGIQPNELGSLHIGTAFYNAFAGFEICP